MTVRAAKRCVRRSQSSQPWYGGWQKLRQEMWGVDAIAIGATPAPSGWAQMFRWHILPLTLYVLFAFIATFPLVLHFGTYVPSDGGDALMNYWGFWWVGDALASFQNPFETPLLYAPYGAPLYLHTLNLLNGLISLPIQWLFGLTPAYNFIIFVSLGLDGYFAYLLITHISGERMAGFIGGVAYAFSAYHLMHLLGHTNLLSSEWIPAYLLCFLRALETRGRQRTRFLALAIGTLILLTLTDWLYVVFGILLTVIIAVWFAVSSRAVTPLVIGAAIGLPWCILSLPLLLATTMEVRSGITDLPDLVTVRNYSADLLSFLIPSTRHWFFGPLALKVERYGAAPPVEGNVFLGYVPLMLALCALWFSRRRAALWLTITTIFIILSLGPVLHIDGRWRFGDAGWSVPLPYSLIMDIPGLSVLRTPVRMALGGTLGLAVLSGLGFVGLKRRWLLLAGARAQALFAAVLIALMLLEQLTIPFPLESTVVPNFYRQLATSSESGTILEWPFSLRRARSDFYQTVHGRPIFGGYVARRLSYPMRSVPPLGSVPEQGSDIFVREDNPDLGAWVLAYSNVRWIVVYLDDPALDHEGLVTFLQRYAEPTPLYVDAQMVVYRPLPPSTPATYLGYVIPTALEPKSANWYEPEVASDGRQMRWFKTNAAFGVWSFGSEPQAVVLRFDAWSYYVPRRLEVRVDGQLVGQWQVEGVQRLNIPLTLMNGLHKVELRSLDPPISPASVGGSAKDTRLLAFAISNVEVQR